MEERIGRIETEIAVLKAKINMAVWFGGGVALIFVALLGATNFWTIPKAVDRAMEGEAARTLTTKIAELLKKATASSAEAASAAASAKKAAGGASAFVADFDAVKGRIKSLEDLRDKQPLYGEFTNTVKAQEIEAARGARICALSRVNDKYQGKGDRGRCVIEYENGRWSTRTGTESKEQILCSYVCAW